MSGAVPRTAGFLSLPPLRMTNWELKWSDTNNVCTKWPAPDESGGRVRSF
jgi:hypothetical protein